MWCQARSVYVKNKNKLCESEIIYPSKLKLTMRSLRLKGKAYAENHWPSPIIPLLIEHAFLERQGELEDVADISITFKEGKDIELC